MSHGFRPAARQKLLEAVKWYLADGGPAVAEKFESTVERAIRVLQFMPLLGKQDYPSARTWPMTRFPYTLVYRVSDGEITVLAVAHQSREPGYWRGRD